MFEGWTSPFAQANQQAQDRATAWDAIKADPSSAALIAGLSLLSNNNGSRSFGQLVGRAGFDTLAGLGSMEAQRRAQEILKMEKAKGNVQVDTANGYLIDKTTGQATPLQGWQAKPTGEMGQYLALSPEDRAAWDARELAMKRAGRAVTNFSNYTNIPYQSAFNKAEGEAASKGLDEYRAEYRNAANALSQYDALEALYADGLRTGTGEEFKANLSKALRRIGVSQEILDSMGFQNAGNVEAFRSIASKALLDTLASQNGPQTDDDARRAAQVWAQLGNTKEGNLWVNQYARNIARRKMDRARFIQKYTREHDGDLWGAEMAWEDQLAKMPSILPEIPASGTTKAPDEGTVVYDYNEFLD